MALSAPNEGLSFNRPTGWRFICNGVNLRDVPDAIGPTKYASLKNVRSTPTQGLQTRPGYTLLFSTGGRSVTDIKAYDTVNPSAFAIRFLARDSANQIWLDNGTLVATLDNSSPTFGVTMLPFRPSESPQSWMYIGSPDDYQKLSAPDPVTGLVTAYKVGIAEPSTAIEAGPVAAPYTDFTGTAASWVAAGVAGAPADSNRATDTAGVVIQDTTSPSRYSVQVTSGVDYQAGETVVFNGTNEFVVQDVLPRVPGGLTILAIRYDSGTSGQCTIVPSQMSLGGAASGAEDPLGALRRGALLLLGGSETVMVLNSTTGPGGSVCFETSTSGTWTAGASISGVPAIVVGDAAGVLVPVAGQAITAPIIVQNSTGSGIATLSQGLASSPFAAPMGASGLFPQTEDYIHVSLKISDPTLLTEMKIIFNVDPTVDYQTNVYYYSVQPSLFAGVTAAAVTQLQAELSTLTQTTLPDGTPIPQQSSAGTGQWTEVMVPISALLRLGENTSLSLAQCNGVQILFNVAGVALLSFGSIWVGGGKEPDTGADGVEYKYRMVPRNSATGVKGNPTPPMRYGVRPRRQQVQLSVPSAAYDPQIDTWDVERYGGSVTSYRYIGSLPSTATSFLDDIGDFAAGAGTLMETDNFQPWPSIDVPFRVGSGSATITVAGTKLVIAGYTTWPTTIDRWLPGTVIQLGGQNSFTLRKRPVKLSSSSYLFDLEECVSASIVPSYVWILEPKVAAQRTTFIFGPDVNGTFFAVNDHLRPGTLLYSKSFNPDSAPDSYNLDLCPPSEVLITGFIKGGVALVASEKRWWALYPQFGNTEQRYNPVEQGVGRGIAAPLGYCTDGATVWFWAKDGIASTDGGPHSSLTDADLYPIFPHEGVPGVNIVRNGVTYYAPDYSNSGTFRLNKVNTYLFADYQDSDGAPRTLVCDLRTGGWVQDVYANEITLHYNNDLQSPPQMLLSDTSGKVYQELDCAGDASEKIDCLVATFEWDGGDLRASPLFGDSYLDCVPQSVITAQPVSQGVAVCAPTTIPASGNRTLAVVSMQGGELQKFLGCVYTWSD